MDVMRKLTTNGAKASSNPSDMETITDNIMNKALTSNALPTFDDIALIFISVKLRFNYHSGKKALLRLAVWPDAYIGREDRPRMLPVFHGSIQEM